ncbi:Cytochrome P450 CYP5280A1P [Beauveria bassiana ARSEF 2860]|uniref:Cytochrome P450 CYP5280A1P n=1 Tax=Beauveria bassiana (strain ARSEF 2860) TaxID=655819 RepID=J4W7A2_BEAB2|nr:Cytochrome P450 CYP5280A1P [Beauveria bassiana ARSEF 2860]EJP66155.1 Cytochrome P450 CYP5280A1P [Beauveria bassiana ARSEF 2860]
MFMLWIAAAVFGLIIIGRPLIVYLQDVKGFRKYPVQNFLSGISPLAYCWEVGRSHRVFHTRRLHEQLVDNPVVRIGPNWLSFGRARAARDIYGYASPCLKSRIYDSLQGGGEHLVNITSRALHSSRRKMVATAYAPRNIERWEPKVTETTTVLLSKLDRQCTQAPKSSIGPIPGNELTFDGNLWGMLYCFECVIKIGLSKDVGFIAQGSDMVEVRRKDGTTVHVNAIDCLHSGSRATSTLIWDTRNFGLWKRISQNISSRYAKQWDNASQWRAFIENMTEERLERFAAGEYLDDLIQLMIVDRMGTDADITMQDRVAEVDQMVNGGGDGPGISLVNTLYYLTKNPETLAKLRAELDEALESHDGVVPWYKVKNLPYLRACVDESMRLSPPVATDLLRKTPPDRSHTIDEVVVPPSTNVSISAYTAHRDPSVFPDPEAFKPERWLIKGQGALKQMLDAYIPFSAGPRGCIGRSVTILMQLVYIGTLVYRYEFALPSPDWEMEWIDYFNLWPKELPLKIWKRKKGMIA